MAMDDKRIRRASTISVSALLATSLFGGAGCAWSDDAQYQARLENTGKPALHAVHGERLRKLMLRLNSLMFERQRTQVEIHKDRLRYAEETAKTAGALLETVEYIARGANELDIEPDERSAFNGLVNKLETQLVTLRTSAERREVDALPAQFNAIVSTCNACHSAFRDDKKERK